MTKLAWLPVNASFIRKLNKNSFESLYITKK